MVVGHHYSERLKLSIISRTCIKAKTNCLTCNVDGEKAGYRYYNTCKHIMMRVYGLPQCEMQLWRKLLYGANMPALQVNELYGETNKLAAEG